jgi:hypothetical protein
MKASRDFQSLPLRHTHPTATATDHSTLDSSPSQSMVTASRLEQRQSGRNVLGEEGLEMEQYD